MKDEESFGTNLSVPLPWIGMKEEDRDCPRMSRHKDLIVYLFWFWFFGLFIQWENSLNSIQMHPRGKHM